MSRALLFTLAVIAVGIASGTEAPFSPLSTFFDIDVSTTASYYTGKLFGPSCARGGAIPDGFVAVAMNGATMGLQNAAAICGMCVAIKGPTPTGPNPADNAGIVGEYYGYVYEVCEDCTQAAGLQLGIPGAGQNSVVWRAIPCPNATAAASPSLFFDGTLADRARFQVRGLSAPIVRATVAGRPLASDGPFFVLDGTGSVFPFTVDLATALGEQLSVRVPAFREYGPMSDLISVTRTSPARPTTLTAPDAQSRFGSGEITTVSGPQTRTVKTVTQSGRQVVTITTGPYDDPTRGAGAPRHQPLYGGRSFDDLVESAEFLNRPLGLSDLGGGRYEQIQVPAGAGANPFPSNY